MDPVDLFFWNLSRESEISLEERERRETMDLIREDEGKDEEAPSDG